MDAPVPKNLNRTRFSWCMYDWANSAYATTVLAGLLPAYFAEVVVGPEGVEFQGRLYSATSLWAFILAAASLISFIAAPTLGAIADFSSSKKKFLLFFAYNGALFTCLLYFCRSGDVTKTLIIFLLAQVGYVSANVFYDAFLPEIATEDELDWVSGQGYSYGYVGGGLQFAIALGLVVGHESVGLSQAGAARVGILLSGLWWFGFTLITAKGLTESKTAETIPERYRGSPRVVVYSAIGIMRTLSSIRRVGRFRHLILFLIAFMLYNDGIQTVIGMATIYGTEELKLTTSVLMVTLLIIQIIASAGALVFSRLANRIGTKQAVMITLILWSAVVIYAYFITTEIEYLLLGIVVGLVMGGSQALSRSFYGSMIPEGASAEFFGFYTVFSKFSAIWGPIAFGVIRQMAGTARISIVSLVFFFVAGLVILHFVDIDKAREAKLQGAF